MDLHDEIRKLYQAELDFVDEDIGGHFSDIIGTYCIGIPTSIQHNRLIGKLIIAINKNNQEV